ncbi:CTD nuclear envelope phosphatase 1 homolog [Drosophila pseudoobscura]|uniref:Mitochondrial import inner membrane translocase subunit TIM50 n=1 Tax=Drosophila pseudoobscura pseudoobscura TaxID=46245 RepID=A0A6I8WA19_DROPS|nr:CTD nuclear envelope phosphatase 1 homolog [Drosophila pseudoobscura]
MPEGANATIATNRGVYGNWEANTFTFSIFGTLNTWLVILIGIVLFNVNRKGLVQGSRYLIFKIFCYLVVKYLKSFYDFTPADTKKRTIIVDMNILISTVFVKKGKQWKKELGVPHDFTVEVPEYEGTMLIYKRPFLDHFLERVSRWFNLVIFIGSQENYATGMLDFLDDEGHQRYQRLYCRNPRRLYGQEAIVLDSTPPALCCYRENTIFVSTYIIGDWDRTLLSLLCFLDSVRYEDEVSS